MQLNDILHTAEITIIKRDFDVLKQLALKLRTENQYSLIPYMALLCYEAIRYLNKRDIKIDIKEASQYSIKDLRMKAKFFDLSINKIMQSIDNIDKLQDDYFVNRMRFPQLGVLNIHDNLGVWFDDDKNIVGNSHYSFYLFQDEKMISKPPEKMMGIELMGKEIFSCACYMGEIIRCISYGLTNISDVLITDVYTDDIIIHSQDFNTNRYFKANKTMQLFLLHILSSIGFILYVLKKAIIKDSGLLLRLEYVTYHYTIKRLKGIKVYGNTNIHNDSNLIQMLNNIESLYHSSLINTDFRNCMMHFGLIGSDYKPLICEEKINLSLPFCGLVESQFDMSYEEYKSKLEMQLLFIYEKIKDYMNFKLELPTDRL